MLCYVIKVYRNNIGKTIVCIYYYCVCVCVCVCVKLCNFYRQDYHYYSFIVLGMF
jgi:hypothetical protein